VSVRCNLTLPEDLAAELKAAARREGVSLARFIRRTLEERLDALRNEETSDPLAWLDGLAELDDTDLAARADDVLYREDSPGRS